MKICYVTVDVAVPHFRGASTHVYEVAKNLALLGNEVHVVSRRINASQPKYELLENVHIHRIYRGIIKPLPRSSYQNLLKNSDFRLLNKPYEWYLFNVFSFYSGVISARIVRKYRLDVIIERETSFGAGAIASLLTKKPLVLEIIGPRYSKLSLDLAKKILAYSKSMITDHAVREDKLFLVDAAVDTERFRPNPVTRRAIREALGLGESIVVGYVGTFSDWHGIEELIKASVKVLKLYPKVQFLMVGPYFERAMKLAKNHKVLDSFVFTGPVPYAEVSKYINAADVLVAPYNPLKSELRRKYGIGSPLKVFEYMACGKPVITTRVNPITRIVEHGETGLLVSAGDFKALAEAIVRLIENPRLAERIGKAAREEVEKNYSWKTFAKKLANILVEVMGNVNEEIQVA